MTTYAPVVHFKNALTGERLWHINGLGSDEPLPEKGDHIDLPVPLADKVIAWRVIERMFLYGANGSRGTVREIVVYLEPVYLLPAGMAKA